MVSYYNENDPYCAEWLRNLVLVGLLPEGDVDDRSISDVDPSDLIGYDQCHFFCGIAGWPLALQIAGWPEDREVWTGSCPCQGLSNAGKRLAASDPRHLWPDFFALIRARRPLRIIGEQVASKLGRDWFDGVRADLESVAYVSGIVDIPACSVNAPHIRNRLWWVAEAGYVGNGDSKRSGWDSRDVFGSQTASRGERTFDGHSADGIIATSQNGLSNVTLVHGQSIGRGEGQSESELRSGRSTSGSTSGTSSPSSDRPSPAGYWDEHEWIACADGKQRRVKPGVHLLVNGAAARIPRIRASGNAIVPALAAEIIKAWMEVSP